MSTQIQEKKQERSKAKTSVTLAARRLIGAANRDVDYEILKSLMTELEKGYDDFCCMNEEFEHLVLEEENVELRIVNGEDIMQYRNNVQRSYEEARDVFVQLKAQNEEINRSKTSGPARLALKLDICRIGELLKASEKNFNDPNPNIQALKLDMQDLQSVVDVMCQKTSELCLIASSQSENDIQLQSEIDKVVGQVYSQVRAINLYLHEVQSLEKAPPSSSKEQISSEGASLDFNEDSSHAKNLPSGPQDVTCSNVGAQPTQAPVNNYDNEIVSSNPQYTAVVDTVMNTTVPSLVPCTNPSSENQVPVVQEPQASKAHKNYLLNPHHLGTPSPTSTYTTQVHFPTLPQHPTSSVVASTLPQHPTHNVVTTTLPQHPTSNVVVRTLPQHPTSNVVVPTLPQHPTHSVVATTLPQHPTSSVVALTLPQHPTHNVVTTTLPQHPTSNVVVPTLPQHPIHSVVATTLPQHLTPTIVEIISVDFL